MSAESTREFVDANVLVYSYDASAGKKKVSAEELLARLWEAGSGCLSVQVLQEFFVTVTGKVAEPLSVDEAAERVLEFSAWIVFAPAANDVVRAIELQKLSKLNFWDAMIVHAAAELGSSVLWTEDQRAERGAAEIQRNGAACDARPGSAGRSRHARMAPRRRPHRRL